MPRRRHLSEGAEPDLTHGLSYEEIAHVGGESEQTVRGRLFRARRTLMKEMASWR
ncbi:sigma factor-like helix-turn-helix DNA-binding protein [Streptomyces antimycoticus]